jgi:Holliday junction resolvasome RuvABC DNA-binding subunit
MINPEQVNKIQSIIQQATKAIDLYRSYMDKYQQDWDESEKNKAFQTLGTLGLFEYELEEFLQKIKTKQAISDADEEMLLEHYLPIADSFSTHIIETLKDIV